MQSAHSIAQPTGRNNEGVLPIVGSWLFCFTAYQPFLGHLMPISSHFDFRFLTVPAVA